MEAHTHAQTRANAWTHDAGTRTPTQKRMHTHTSALTLGLRDVLDTRICIIALEDAFIKSHDGVRATQTKFRMRAVRVCVCASESFFHEQRYTSLIFTWREQKTVRGERVRRPVSTPEHTPPPPESN
jgi:hypothetical protein